VDVADPVEITDRAQLDELYARKAKLRDFADEQLNLGFDERWARDIQTPWIHVALIPNPANTTEPAPLKLGGFRRIIKETKGGINLPDVYSSALGYIARNHRMQEVPHGAAVTFEYAHNGAMFITIPLSSMTIDLPPFTHPRVG
jgi:hypothetical protein